MLVPNSRYDEAVEIAAAAASQTQVGDPTEEGMHLGPLISQAQWDRVQGYIQTGLDEGAVVAAVASASLKAMRPGYFVKPTVLANVTNDMTVAQEEIFGPVLSIIGYDDDDDAVASPMTASTACPVACGQVTRSERSPWLDGCALVRSTSTEAASTSPHRSVATSSRATDARTASTASTSSSRRSPSSSDLLIYLVATPTSRCDLRLL